MKKKTFKRLTLISLIFIIIAGSAVIYLNKFFLPTKIKSLIIQAMEKETQKKITLESVQFNIFKGLVLKNLNIYDGQKILISLKEASCAFFILPIFTEKKVVIPSLKLKEPTIFLERKADNTLNLMELLPKKKAQPKKPKFSILISYIKVTGARLDFQDDTLSPAFTKSIYGLDLDILFSLPASIKFNFKSKIQAEPVIAIDANGKFQILDNELTAKIAIKDLPPGEFSAYYRNLGVSFKKGKVDAAINLNLKNNLLNADILADNKAVVLSKDKILTNLNSEIKANLQYNLKDKQLKYSGKANIVQADISGIENGSPDIKDIKGEIEFDNSGLSSDKIMANIFGFPIEAKINLSDFNKPHIALNAVSELNLKNAQAVILEKLKFPLPLEISGKGRLSLVLKAELPIQKIPQINGLLDISSATVKIDKIASPFKDISGLLNFTADGLSWTNLNFSYLDTVYKTQGVLTNFNSPLINLNLTSSELFLNSDFSLKGKLIEISKLEGKYLNSNLFLKGNINIADARAIRLDVNAELAVNLEDLNKLPVKFKNRIEQIKPSGLVKARLNLNADINNLKFSNLRAEVSGSSLSAYGLKSEQFLLNYNQSDGLADIALMRLSLYDGTLEASAKINLDTEDMPFWVEAKVNDIKIEKLIMDTPAKTQDLAGTIQGIAKLNGFLTDLSRLSGAGKILIKDGKLWELNLLKGLGKLLFTKDFTDIIFNEGYCEFFIKDKFIFSENLKLKSALVNLEGSGKIGFDSSLDASINVQMGDELAPETGTIKDITTAFIGQAGRFAVIKLSGTLQKPEYKFKPAVVDVIKGLKDTILENIFGR